MRDLRALATAVAMLAIACGTMPSPDLGSQVGPSPIVLKDTSPSELTVFVAVNMGYIDQGQDNTLIDVNFQHDGRPVKFIAGERMTCNGTPVKSLTGSFEVEFPTASIAGTQVKCLYQWGAQTTSLNFDLPPPLVILAPANGQKVDRGSNTAVHYSGATDTNLWVVALGPDAKAVAKPGDIATTMATLDTTALGAGAGSVTLTDPLDFSMTRLDGRQFRSIAGTARRTTTIAVVWV